MCISGDVTGYWRCLKDGLKNCILNICCSLVDELKGFFLAGKIVLNQSVSLGISVKKRECMVIEFRNSFLLTACVFLYTFTVYLCNRVMLLVSPTCWHIGESKPREAWQCLPERWSAIALGYGCVCCSSPSHPSQEQCQKSCVCNFLQKCVSQVIWGFLRHSAFQLSPYKITWNRTC